jgi:oxygen-independent coproporphyrinogen-3 oxidase
LLYLHIPFCHRKCTYCAFFSAVTSGSRQDYVDALCREAELRCAEQPHPLRTVYFGGGTPSILSLGQLRQIVDTIARCFDLSQLQEATLEANPEDLTPEYLRGLRNLHFFNRLSIGLQSFSDDDLRLLNRRHSAAQSRQAVLAAADAGFHNLSVDLIYGLPDQSLDRWQHNLAQLSSLPITHLSAYALTVEPGTMLQRQVDQHRVVPADEDTVLSHYHALLRWAAQAGFEQYEISNFCRPGFPSRHNSRYWDRTPYLGLGAAAHSFDGSCRRWNVAHLQRYILSVAHGNPDHQSETLSPTDAFNELLITSLRTVQGISKVLVPAPFLQGLTRRAAPLVAAGLLQETPTHFRPTPAGLLQADGIAVQLMADSQPHPASSTIE